MKRKAQTFAKEVAEEVCEILDAMTTEVPTKFELLREVRQSEAYKAVMKACAEKIRNTQPARFCYRADSFRISLSSRIPHGCGNDKILYNAIKHDMKKKGYKIKDHLADSFKIHVDF